MTTPAVLRLHAHAPAALLPLLEQFQPHTLPHIGAIRASPSLDAVYSTLPDVVPAGPAAAARSFVVALALPLPCKQIHVYHSLEVSLGRSADGSDGPLPTDETVASAATDVVDAVIQLLQLYPEHTIVGGLHEAWGPAVRAALGDGDRGGNSVFAAPGLQGATAAGSKAPRFQLSDEMRMDGGLPGDEQHVHAHNPYHSAAYYRSRLDAGYMTAIRPAPRSGEEGSYTDPVCWVITHANGSYGALFTVPQYRGRGLARTIVAEHIRGVGGSYRSFVYVTVGNAASESLWESMGWVKSGIYTWVATARH